MTDIIIPSPLDQALGMSVVALTILALLGFLFAPDKARYVLELMGIVLRVRRVGPPNRLADDPNRERDDGAD